MPSRGSGPAPMCPVKSTTSPPRVPCWIDNSPSPFNQPLFIHIPVGVDPETKPLCYAQGASAPLALAAAQSTANAREAWSNTSSVDRLRILQQTANLFERRREVLLLYLCTELGIDPDVAEVIFNQSIGEIIRTNSRFANTAFSNRHIAALGPRPTPETSTPTYSGGTLVLSAAALPILLQTITNSLSSGRSILLLASNQMPRTHHFIVNAFTQSGLPPGCLNKVHCRPEDEAQIIDYLLQSPAIQMVEVCDDRKEMQEKMWELGRKYHTHVVCRTVGK